MRKTEFLNLLEQTLSNISIEEKNEILYDYEEHFQMGLKQGKTEEEIAASLGDPKTLAKEFTLEHAVKRAETDTSTGNVLRAVFATISLGFFNVIFILGPFLALIGILTGLFAASFGITISGLALFGSAVLFPVFRWNIHMPFSIHMSPLATFFAATGTTALGLLFIIGTCYLAMYFYRATLQYIKLNLRIITGRRL